MATNINLTSSNTNRRHWVISMLLFGGLLFLRFPFLTTLGTVLPDGSQFRLPTYVVFVIGTCLLTAILIWWERERLQDFWIDIASAITFLCQTFCFPIGIGLFATMRRSRTKFPAPPTGVWRWALIGAILALLSNILTTHLGIEPSQPRGTGTASFVFLVPALLIQMTNAAVFEEPLFRGFLWGYLRRWRWPNGLIWLFQAALFTLGHVYYLKKEAFLPWLIRMMLPSLVIGLVAWRARSIFASMVTHGMVNASGDMLMHTRSLSEALQVSWSVVGICAAILVGGLVLERLRHRAQAPQCIN